MSDTVTDYCPSCRLINGLPPTTDPVGTYQACPSCDPSTPILSCPEHRSTALATLDLPANQYYHCPTCDDEWCNGPEHPGLDLHDYAMGLFVAAFLAFQFGVMLTFTLGLTLVLRDNYGYSVDSAIGHATLYAFLIFIFWITVLFPALWHAFDVIVARVRHGLLGYPVPR